MLEVDSSLLIFAARVGRQASGKSRFGRLLGVECSIPIPEIKDLPRFSQKVPMAGGNFGATGVGR